MKIILPLLFIATIVFSCSSSNTDCGEVEHKYEETSKALIQRDSVLTFINTTFRQLDSNMLTIRTLESEIMKEIQMGRGEAKVVKEKVNELKLRLEANDAFLADLKSKMSLDEGMAGFFIDIVNSMESKVAMSNQNLSALNTELGALSAEFKNIFNEYVTAEVKRMEMEENIAGMESSMSDMQQEISDLKSKMNKVYVAFGTKQDLQDRGIIEKGILKPKEINEDTDYSEFKAYDVREFESMELPSYKIKFVSEHPSETYKVANRVESSTLTITNQDEFWRISKVLIVQIE
ncbi:MAG: hypothetical protein HN728_08235 [Flavobacteriales bacterium]|jgi:chromosome segregation ATPase|nr:hypothetical protein [Flavobacteriales bacterium]NCG30058.1 hypothetical protein [Bacteroidota bacterium]MBT4930086.1 hypothetical protein [Flavobacteriales bacterium]MBT5133044.1 hypothetical protein [Flavobacteriales bacterium]MBT5976630.1 hypothetical protein [Flavobacteriales bacterium]